LIYVNIPDEALVLKYALFTPSGSARDPDAASCDRTAERRWMMDAFSNARDVWVVGLVVNASFLTVSSALEQTAIIPSEGNLDLGEPQLKQFKLAEILVQQISPYTVSLLPE
jgi:hypothetical protein